MFFRVDTLKPWGLKYWGFLTVYLWFLEKIFSDDVPRCEKCNSLVKPGRRSFEFVSFFTEMCAMPWSVSSISLFFLPPDIVFFGENLPVRFFTSVKSVSFGYLWVFGYRHSKNKLYSLSCRTSLVVISLSSWEHLCRSNLLPVLSAGMTDLYSCFRWKDETMLRFCL